MSDPRSTGNKSKAKQMGLYQTQHLLHNKQNDQQNGETFNRMEKMFAKNTYLINNFQIYQQLKNSKTKKTSNPAEK